MKVLIVEDEISLANEVRNYLEKEGFACDEAYTGKVASEKLFSNESFHPDRYFERTGCLLTLDGSEDDKVNIQGLPNYKPPIPQDTGMDDIGFCEVVPTVTALEPQIPDHDINLEDIFEEDVIEITESDDGSQG